MKKVLLAGVSLLCLALAGCGEEPIDMSVYEDVQACIQANQQQLGELEAGVQCRKAWSESEAVYLASAPVYNTLAECETEFGVSSCKPRADVKVWDPDTAQKEENAPEEVTQSQATTTGGGYSPATHWMLFNMMNGNARGAPAYWSQSSRTFYDAGLRSYTPPAPGSSTLKGTASTFDAKPAQSVRVSGGLGKTGATVRSMGGIGAAH